MESQSNFSPELHSARQTLSPTKIMSEFGCTSKNQLTGTCAETREHFAQSFAKSIFTHNTSLTEKEIYTHGLIKEIMDESRKKTVNHFVNKIPMETRLYVIPLHKNENQFKFDTIPPRNIDYASTCSKKVNQIHKRLSENVTLSERLSELAEKNKEKLQKARPSSAKTNKNLTVSGLVTYNFNSVRAKKSIGSIPQVPDEVLLMQKVKNLQKKNSCSMDRQARIMNRKPKNHTLFKYEIGKAAVCDFETSTSKFLKILQRESEKDQKIFGAKMEKLSCIKQYMEKEHVDYDEAEFIVQEILASQSKPKQASPQKEKVPFDEEKELAKRKQVSTRKRLMLNHLYFADM